LKIIPGATGYFNKTLNSNQFDNEDAIKDKLDNRGSIKGKLNNIYTLYHINLLFLFSSLLVILFPFKGEGLRSMRM
jgi:hypothetical protein